MRKISKTIAIILASLMLLSMLSACDGKDNKKDTSTPIKQPPVMEGVNGENDMPSQRPTVVTNETAEN